MAEHRGGTLKLLAKAAGGSLDPQVNYTLEYWQLYRATQDGLVTFKAAGGDEAFKIVPDLAVGDPEAHRRRQDLDVQAAQGHQVLERQDRASRSDVLYTFERIFKVHTPTAGGFYSVLVGADKCLKTPATCDLSKSVVVDNKAGTVTFHLTQPDAEWLDKLAVPHAAMLPVRHAQQGSRHGAPAGHGRVHVHEVRPEPRAPDGAQQVLQAVVGRRAARRLRRQHLVHVRPDRRGPDHADRERHGRLDARVAARRPPQRDRHQVPVAGAHQHAARELVPADERQHPAVQQQAGAPGGQLRGRPQRGRPHPRRPEAGDPELPGAARRLPGARRLLPVHEEPGREVVGTRSREGQAARQGVRHGRRARSRSSCRQRRGQQGDGRVRPERAELDRLQGDRSRRSPATSSSPTSRTRRTRSRSRSRSGTRTIRRRRTSCTCCSAASRSTPAATRASTCPASATRRSTPT